MSSQCALYRAANMYLIEPLENRVFRFLTSTCTVDNICKRLFNLNCKYYDELKKAYIEYLAINFDLVKMTKEWSDVMNRMAKGKPQKVEYDMSVLLDVTKMLRGKGG